MSTSKTANAALGVVALSTIALAAAATYKYGYKHEPLPKVNLRMPDFAALRGKLPPVKMPAFKLPAALQRKPAQA
ncbi:dimethylsulfoxide reductase [Chlorella sorokiniana]|uniref:Dimethylsulfoxide reductase n=1 Tax=Chlorella sorokiniana TaxID=3076 RepID=A0A2P6TU82_CHLSO|nr:dimethylsulfoxide reductase [Chlorella sorokiniana]|eukprot:PRW57619.1 dimethylsulfoxide reductase [Chlorella sorokiniana]